MANTLLDEFEKYENIKNNKKEITDFTTLSPTIILSLSHSNRLKSENISSIRRIGPQKDYFGLENEILTELNIPNSIKMY